MKQNSDLPTVSAHNIRTTYSYDSAGRLVASNMKSWNDGGNEPSGDSLEHTYAGSRHIQNYDGSSTYGARWHWAGAQNDHGAPLRAPSADTSSQQAYYSPSAGGAGQPERRSFLAVSTSEGDKRLLFAQGRPMAKDASGGGSGWSTGTMSDKQSAPQSTVESRFFFTGTVTATDMSRATDKREKDRLGIFGTSNSYAGSYGRVTSEPIGRDLNPLGRGSGQAFVAGGLNLGRLTSPLAGSRAAAGTGNSVNNGGCDGIGDGCKEIPEPGLPPSGFDPGFSGGSGRTIPDDPISQAINDIYKNMEKGHGNPIALGPGDFVEIQPKDPIANNDPYFNYPGPWRHPKPIEPPLIVDPRIPGSGGLAPPISVIRADKARTRSLALGLNEAGNPDPCECCWIGISKESWCDGNPIEGNEVCRALGAIFNWPGAQTFCCMWHTQNHYGCEQSNIGCISGCLMSAFGSILGKSIWQRLAGWISLGQDVITDWWAVLVDVICILLGLWSLPAALLVAIAKFIACKGCCDVAFEACNVLAHSGGCQLTTGGWINFKKVCPW